jgi:hypothetical protein
VAGLHAVAGERRLDRILPDEFREQWRTLDERAGQHKERERKQAERKAAAAKRPPPPRVSRPGWRNVHLRRPVVDYLHLGLLVGVSCVGRAAPGVANNSSCDSSWL